MKYYIELQKKYNGNYPEYIAINQHFNSIEEAKAEIKKIKKNPENADYTPYIRAEVTPTPIENYLTKS